MAKKKQLTNDQKFDVILNEIISLNQGLLSLQQGQADLQQDVSSLKQGQTDLQQDVSSLKQGQTDLKKDMKSVKKQLKKIKQTQDDLIDVFDQDIIENRKKIDSIETRLSFAGL